MKYVENVFLMCCWDLEKGPGDLRQAFELLLLVCHF